MLEDEERLDDMILIANRLSILLCYEPKFWTINGLYFLFLSSRTVRRLEVIILHDGRSTVGYECFPVGGSPIPWSDFINNYPGLSSDHGKVLEDDGLTVVFQKFNRPSSGILEAHGMMLESTNRK